MSERRLAELERRLTEVEAQRDRDNRYFTTQIEQLKSRVYALEGEQARADVAKRCDDEAAQKLLTQFEQRRLERITQRKSDVGVGKKIPTSQEG